jgi:hypothetical protein
LTGENPGKSIVKSTKNPNPVFPSVFAQHMEHSYKTMFHIFVYKDGSARTWPEDSTFRHFANTLRVNFRSGYMREVQQLRITGVEIRIGKKLVLMSKRRNQVEQAGCRAQHQRVRFVYFVKRGHF